VCRIWECRLKKLDSVIRQCLAFEGNTVSQSSNAISTVREAFAKASNTVAPPEKTVPLGSVGYPLATSLCEFCCSLSQGSSV
jgi:hypothetical protein